MSELWALLHFIMPNLFDSHEQFQEWFSKDIEAHSQEKGELNQEQLKRLHQILKPFMLRRVKKDVEHEIGPKKEYEILCYMTEKQKILYNSIKQKLNNISDNIGKVPFTFKDILSNNETNSVFTILNGEQYLRINEHPAINYAIPKMIYDLCFDKFNYMNYIPKKLFICDDINLEYNYNLNKNNYNSLFNIFHLFGMSFYQIKQLLLNGEFISQLFLHGFFQKKRVINEYYKNNEFNRI